MSFKKYPKIHRLGKEETEGILEGHCVVQEKIDGANVSVWIDKRGELTCGSRNRELTEGFNGFVDYIKAHEGVTKLLHDFPAYRLYGEWLVRHTISYDETKMQQFYLFDMTVVKDGEETEEFIPQEKVREFAESYGINYPHVFGEFTNPSEEALKEFVGQSQIGPKGEGIVIKNLEHTDKFGNHCYAKIVTEEFKEDNGITFGGNNKHSDTYWEMYIVNKYMTLSRIQKVMNKIQPTVDEKLDLQHIPRITSSAYHDMLTEEIWDISKKVGTVDFKALKRVANKKAVQIYKDIINNTISIADEGK